MQADLIKMLVDMASDFAALRRQTEDAIDEAHQLRAKNRRITQESILMQMCASFSVRSKDLLIAVSKRNNAETTKVLTHAKYDFLQLEKQDFSWSATLEKGAALQRAKSRLLEILNILSSKQDAVVLRKTG